MKADLLIQGARLVTPSYQLEADVAIKEGKILAIGRGEDISADEVIYAKGLHLLPGVIDSHVHFRDPGYSHKEDWITGSMAAAMGGVTMVMAMPNTDPLSTSREGFEKHRERASRSSYIDFAIIGGIGEESVGRAKELAEAGAIAFKSLMGGYRPQERPDIKGWHPILDDGRLLEAFEDTASMGLVHAVHAEDEELRAYFTEKARKEGRKDAASYSLGRPAIVEIKAITRALLLAREANCKLHIVHMGVAEGVELVARAKARGQMVSVETCPHYLLLNSEDVGRIGPEAIINPPIKSEEDRLGLWRGINAGIIDTIATDHSPHTLDEKYRGVKEGDIFRTMAGFCGVETMLPLLLNEVSKGNLTLEHLVKLTSENPAKVFGLYPKKGALLVGSDADLTLVDMSAERTIKRDELHSKCKITPFDGWRVKGWPVITIVRGRVVMRDGRMLVKPGYGRFVPGKAYAGD